MSVILVTVEEFLKRKHTYAKDANIEKKYTQLISSYECFNKVIYYHKGTAVRAHDKKRPIPPKHDERKGSSTSKKSLNSLWNTLNESNYQKISNRIKFMVNDGNVTNIVMELVNMSILHSIYRKYFMMILRDVIHSSSDRNKVYDILTSHLASFDRNYFVLKGVDVTDTDYDVFCKLQKHKNKCVQTIGLLIDLVGSAINTETTIIDVWNLLQDCFTPDVDHEYYMDIFIHGIFLLLEHKDGAQVVEKIKTILDAIQEAAIKNNMSMKIQFMIEKLRGMLKFERRNGLQKL